MSVFSTAQLQAIKADIIANSDLNTAASDQAVAILYNLPASPSWTIWKVNVSINSIGKSFNGTELAGMTTGNQTRLQTLAQYLSEGVNPSLADNRAFFDDVFSGAGGTNTRANLLALWKRTATRLEKLLSTGTGSNASPATLPTAGYIEGLISVSDIDAARHS